MAECEAGCDSSIDVFVQFPLLQERKLHTINIIDFNGVDHTVQEVKKELCNRYGITNYNNYELKFSDQNLPLQEDRHITEFLYFLCDHSLILILRECGKKSQKNNSSVVLEKFTRIAKAGEEFVETVEEVLKECKEDSLAFEEYKSSMTKSGREYFEKTEVAAKVLKRKFSYDKSFHPGMSLIQQCLHTHFQMLNSIIESMSQCNYHPGENATNQFKCVYKTKTVTLVDTPEYKVLRRIYKYIIDNIEANDLIDKLFEIEVIDFHLKVEIRLMANRKDRNRKLVDIILEGCPETFKKFLASLKTNYDYMADKLLYEYEKENEAKALTSSTSEADENNLSKRLKIKNQSNTSTEDK